MSFAKKITEKIAGFPKGDIFTYADLSIQKDEYSAASKAIERLIKKEIIKRLSPGVFYKANRTAFGELKPAEEKIITPYLFSRGRRIAYITGLLLYNKMGLTTQVPRVLSIASRDKRIYISKGNIKATAEKSYVDVTDENYKFLEFLDVLKDWNKIPDLDRQSGVQILKSRLQRYNEREIEEIIGLALFYPPRVRAFLAALIEDVEKKVSLNRLKESLNPFSTYNLGLSGTLLPTAKKWRIK